MTATMFSSSGAGVFADYVDLQAAVVELVGNADIVDVMPRLLKSAEMEFNRRLRTRDMMSSQSLTASSGTAALPTDFLEAIGLFTSAGVEYVQQPVQEYTRRNNTIGFYTISGSNLLADDAEYTLKYYSKIATINGGVSETNWVLQKHPHLYLYGVALEAFKHMRDMDGVQQMMQFRDMEFAQVAQDDFDERFSRARVRLAGVTP